MPFEVANGSVQIAACQAGSGLDLMKRQCARANAIEFGNNSYSDGPVVGSTLIFGNNVTTNSFPNIDFVPSGDPGNSPVFGHPNPPTGFSS